MSPTQDQLLDLVHSLLENGRNLCADARLLHENGRNARCYALAALAGEELAKLEYCLDWLMGLPTMTDKDFRRSWQNHAEKLRGLVAYQVAFVDEAMEIDSKALQERSQTIARRKMDAIYVDFREHRVVTPTCITADEAAALLQGVEAALTHASTLLGPINREIVEVFDSVGLAIAAPLEEFVTGLPPAQAVVTLRELAARMPSITAEEWTAALEADEVAQLLGLAGLPGHEEVSLPARVDQPG